MAHHNHLLPFIQYFDPQKSFDGSNEFILPIRNDGTEIWILGPDTTDIHFSELFAICLNSNDRLLFVSELSTRLARPQRLCTWNFFFINHYA